MGILDRFKKKEKPINTVPTQVQNNVSLDRYRKADGKNYIELHYYNALADFKDFYDTTCLMIKQEPEVLPNGSIVYLAQVSWYGQQDAVMLDDRGEDIGRKSERTDIRLVVDLERLVDDTQYQKVLMTQLVEKKRVERYMQQGMEEDAKQPCGNYIGEIGLAQTGDGQAWYYRKVFNTITGRQVHNLPDQVERRQRYKQLNEQKKRERIEQLEAKKQKIQEEIDHLR